jgi:hypothetical protein
VLELRLAVRRLRALEAVNKEAILQMLAAAAEPLQNAKSQNRKN